MKKTPKGIFFLLSIMVMTQYSQAQTGSTESVTYYVVDINNDGNLDVGTSNKTIAEFHLVCVELEDDTPGTKFVYGNKTYILNKVGSPVSVRGDE